MTNSNDPLQDAKKARLEQQIKTITTDLARVAATDIPQLQERIFVNVFLPFFAGDESLIYPADLNLWLNVTGSPYRSVNIIDDSTGQILFTVPPVFDRASINPVDGTRNSLSHVLATTSQYAAIHPNQGIQYLNNELSQRAMIMKVPDTVLKEATAWNAIFTRYGRPPLKAFEDSPVAEPTTIPLNLGINYDDADPL
jgi:hypothetical protein